MPGAFRPRRGMRAYRWPARMIVGVATALVLAGCASSVFESMGITSPATPPNSSATGSPPASVADIGNGQLRVGLILPLSAQGNAGVAAQSMKNGAEMAMVEFKESNIRLLVKDSADSPQNAQVAAQQLVTEGAEIIIGPLFAQ